MFYWIGSTLNGVQGDITKSWLLDHLVIPVGHGDGMRLEPRVKMNNLQVLHGFIHECLDVEENTKGWDLLN